MQKLIQITLAILGLSFPVYNAYSANSIQAFDNEINFGYTITNSTLTNGANQAILLNNQILSLEVERLFDAGVWVDAVGNMLLATNSLGNKATGTGMQNAPVTQDPNFAGINIKVGYNFPLVSHYLSLTPYGLIGRNTNLTYATILANNQADITKDIFYTLGFGGRMEYRINPYIELHLDQLAGFNYDQSQPINGISQQNNINYTTTFGAKFKPYRDLFLAVNTFYTITNYTSTINMSQINGGCVSQLCSIYQPNNTIGLTFNIGLSY